MHDVRWIDLRREPQCPPDPAYPHGKEVVIGGKRTPGLPICTVALPYPARRCGLYVVRCDKCGLSVALSTAGRPDDPRSVRIPCRPPGFVDEPPPMTARTQRRMMVGRAAGFGAAAGAGGDDDDR